ncbi:MAG TPA: hypothetical protein VGI92_09695 [Gemmatimonadales bacterium]|jgi:hypothetical protein
MDRHADIDELIALRDGEGTDWVRSHAQGCEPCAAELFRLEQLRARLKALPAFAPPRDRWPMIAAQAKRERRSRWVRSASGIAAALALTGLTFLAIQPRHADAATESASLDRAMARSQALEQTLKSLHPQQQALNSDAAAVVAELQDQLSRIDQQLAQPGVWKNDGGAANLWQERAGVLGALVDVHITRAAAAGL